MTNRNSDAHFELAPQVGIERSTYEMPTKILTSFNVGKCIPFYCLEVLPGDTFQITTSKVARLQTLIAPVMDDLYLDTYYFFVPNRLVWNHWANFLGERDPNKYSELPTYEIPMTCSPDSGWLKGTIADYFGIPTQVPTDHPDTGTQYDLWVNSLPFRAYAKIWNDWFRDENLQNPVVVDEDYDGNETGDNLEYLALSSGYGTNLYCAVKGGYPLPANKMHDFFTSCTRSPQKGPSITFLDGIIPVKTLDVDTVTGANLNPLRIKNTDNSGVSSTQYVSLTRTASGSVVNNLESSGVAAASGTRKQLVPTNLYASIADIKDYDADTHILSNSSDLTINALRQAFQIQRMLEKDARGGTRLIELIKSHFGVTSPDARMQRSEYLGGNRVPLNIEQVVNTTGNTTLGLKPGDVSGWSQTNDTSYDVEKSFTEHGYIIGIMCARYKHTYQQGLEKHWSRRDRFDFYWPALAHLGEQAVKKREIYCNGVAANDNLTFGYQEAWAEYRYKPNYVTGAMRSNCNNSLDIWHFADNYSQSPTLSAKWIAEDPYNVDRALTVSHTVEDQIFVDIYVRNKATRPLPLYSIPGYIDHF